MKKLIALLLSLVLAFGMVACGASQNVQSTEDGASTAQRFSRFDSTEWDGSLPLVQEGEDNKLTLGIRSNPNVLDFDTNELTLWLEEQTGVDIEFVVFTGNSKDAATQVSLMVAAGEELPDILFGFGGINKATAKEYIRDGYFADLSPYMTTNAYYTRQALDLYYADDPETLAVVEKFMIDTVVDPVSNTAIGFPGLFNNPSDSNLSHIWINQVWLDKLGLQQPTTVDELYDVLVAFRDGDPNGNGLKDEIPALCRANNNYSALLQWIANAYIFEYDKYKFNVENDVVYAPYDQPEYREALIFIRKLVDEGLLSPMSWTVTEAECIALVNPTGDAVPTVGLFAGPGDSWFEEGHESIYQYTVQHALADETGRGGWAPTTVDQVDYANYITADCENVLLAFRFMDFMSSPEGYLRQRWGVRGVDWDYVDEGNTLPGFLGGEARIDVMNPYVFADINNQNWHMQRSICSEGYWQYTQDLGDGSWKSALCLQLQAVRDAYENGKHPEQQIFNVNRTEENDEAYTAANADITSYYQKARAEFCTGLRNPSNDADWNTYLKDLENLGYYTDWVAPAQLSWDMDRGVAN